MRVVPACFIVHSEVVERGKWTDPSYRESLRSAALCIFTKPSLFEYTTSGLYSVNLCNLLRLLKQNRPICTIHSIHHLMATVNAFRINSNVSLFSVPRVLPTVLIQNCPPRTSSKEFTLITRPTRFVLFLATHISFVTVYCLFV